MSTDQLLMTVGAVAALVAAIYAVKSWRLQKRQDSISVVNGPLTDEELQILRTVDRFGPVSRTPGSPCFWIGEKQLMVGAESAWIEEAIDSLRHKNLLERHAVPVSLTSDGSLVLRAKAGRKVPQRKIQWVEQAEDQRAGRLS